MFAPFRIKVGARAVTLAVALATSSFSAQAVLERVGPVSLDPTAASYPAWYQDTTGIALEYCNPLNSAEVAGGWCLLLPPDIPAVPEVFPANYFDEHFYFAAGAAATASLYDPVHGRALLVIAQEAAFANGPAVPGDQVTFARIRVSLSPLPASGTYRFIHPYGEEVIEGVAGDRIFFTDDVGVGCSGLFNCALKSRLGPFLMPSITPGGAEMPPLTASNPTPDIDPANFEGIFMPTPYPNTGKAYIADPNRIGPVTGSALPDFIDSTGASRNHNVFRIEGPSGSGLGIDPATGAPVDWVETTKFQLMGRLYDGTMPGQAKIDRASYTRNANGQKLDVYATGGAATAARFPAQPAPAKIVPTLSFFDAPCAGTVDAAGNIKPPYSAPVGATETQMLATGPAYWGQIQPAVLPAAVCVKNGNARDAAGNIRPVYALHAVTDEVTVTQANYDGTAGTLTVAATSSDELVPPALKLTYRGYAGDLVGGQIVVPNVVVSPARVTVQSSAAGHTAYMVNTAFPSGVIGAGTPVATPDSYAFPEDSGAHVLTLLANDVDAAGGTISLTSLPVIGTAVANLDGTVSYTGKVNANGADSFTYTVTKGALVSSPATVSVNLTPVNDAPVAVNDDVSVTVGVPTTVSLIGNDTDPDGNADVVAVGSFTQPNNAAVTITAGATPGTVSILSTVSGTFTFRYTAQDAAGAQSTVGTGNNQGTVTLTVNPTETVSINKNQYDTGKATLSMEGDVNPPSNSSIKVEFTNNAGTVLGLAANTVASAGRFKVNQAVALPAGATRLLVTTSKGATVTGTLVIR
ncbi:MAG: cadherin-like domain-containing protein [Burkholderiales bacterium]|nr:cadherin-like domain-containing protein [Burkholderiales bacterium]